jgi:hypothetical protein
VTIPTSVTNIGDHVFDFCPMLTSITIPSSVISIGNFTFNNCTGLTNFNIPDSVLNIGVTAFEYCTNLMAITVETNNAAYSSLDGVLFNHSQTALVAFPEGRASLGSYIIPGGVTTIGACAFYACSALTNITVPSGVTSIGSAAFRNCSGLTSLIFPGSVTNIADDEFSYCYALGAVYFEGNAPAVISPAFWYSPTTVYYLPGAEGWSTTFGDAPTALWIPKIQTNDGSFGVQNNQFGFNINWAGGQTVVVEACTNLSNPVWIPVATNILTGSSSYFSDPQWTNNPVNFYRLLSP